MSRDYLEEMRTVLAPLDEHLERGTSDMIDDNVWNYMIYGRDSRSPSGINRLERFFVVIVREIEIPEETIQSVLDAVRTIPGFRLTNQDMQFEYQQIGSTKQVAEAVKILFEKVTKD